MILRYDLIEPEARSMFETKYLFVPLAATMLVSTATPSTATSCDRNQLDLDSTLAIVRHKLINRGLLAYKAGYYPETVYLLRDFLSRRRIIKTSLEKEGLNYLALAYQKMGKSDQAMETITRAILVANNSSIELANFENTAGIIANQQNKKNIANHHWEKARQLYLANNFTDKWTEITLDLAQNHRQLGDYDKYQQLLQELKSIS